MHENEGRGTRPGAPKNPENTTPREQGSWQKESTANNPLTSLTREQQGWYERSHEELVKAFRGFFQKQYQQAGGIITPELLVRSDLRMKAMLTLNEMEHDFFNQLTLAWDALAYDRYADPINEGWAGLSLEDYYQRTHEPTIKLSHPVQIKVIDALTEAVGIPHQKGQKEIEIPEDLRHWAKFHSKR